jgi:hypothetical protein
MPCPTKIVPLPCAKSGVALTAAPVTCPAGTTINLMTGGGAMFPAIPAGMHFYVTIGNCDCCAEAKVTALVGDVMTVEFLGAASACACVPANSHVRYERFTRTALDEMVLEAVGKLTWAAPLKFDCATRTVSIDCATMATGCAPCGT